MHLKPMLKFGLDHCQALKCRFVEVLQTERCCLMPLLVIYLHYVCFWWIRYLDILVWLSSSHTSPAVIKNQAQSCSSTIIFCRGNLDVVYVCFHFPVAPLIDARTFFDIRLQCQFCTERVFLTVWRCEVRGVRGDNDYPHRFWRRRTFF